MRLHYMFQNHMKYLSQRLRWIKQYFEYEGTPFEFNNQTIVSTL